MLSTPVFEVDNTPNDQLHSYQSKPIELTDGVIISTVDLRLKRVGKDSGFLVLDIGGNCITTSQLMVKYDYLRITGTPSGHSLLGETSYSQDMPWGRLSFGFEEKNPNCLADVAFDPKKDD